MRAALDVGVVVWAILSDIHGNDAALERALALARERGATRFAFLGDLLGRGDSDRCVALARRWADLAVVGNRDLDWQDRVSAESRAYVLSLPRVAEAESLLAVHGDERLTPGLGSGEIRRGFGRAYARLTASGKRLLFFGHTHHARIWRKDGAQAEPVLLADALVSPNGHVALDREPGMVWIVNVGSVGLPFPGKGPASFALYDVANAELEFLPVSP